VDALKTLAISGSSSISRSCLLATT